VLILVGLLQPLVLFTCVQNFNRTVELLCDDQNFSDHCKINIYIYTILWKYVLGRTYILGRKVLVLVGLLKPLVRLFVKNFTRTVELLCDGQHFPDHWAITMNVYTIL
jgi:hypothetical protein